MSDKNRRELTEKFQVSRKTVWCALNYITNSDLAKEIRTWALQHGGRVEEEDFLPNCRTEHTEDAVIQTFAGGVQVRISKRNSGVDLLEDGQVSEHYDNVTIQAWGNLLHHAQLTSEARLAAR